MGTRKQFGKMMDIFAKTTIPAADGNGVPAGGKTLSVSVGLKETELHCLDEIAREHKIARNAVHRFAIRHFLRAYGRGEVTLEMEPPLPQKRKLRME